MIFNGSGRRLFKNLGSGSVRVQLHQNLKVRFAFRFNDLKFKRFRFGSGSPKKSDFYWFAIQVPVPFDSLFISDSLNFEKQKDCNATQHTSRDFY